MRCVVALVCEAERERETGRAQEVGPRGPRAGTMNIEVFFVFLLHFVTWLRVDRVQALSAYFCLSMRV